MGWPQLLLVTGLVLALLWAAWGDLRTRIIPNPLNAGIALAAPLWWWASGLPLWPNMALQLAVGAIVFALFALFFMVGAMGGGDVKLVAALALWLPFELVLAMLFIMALAGGVVTIATMIVHRIRVQPGRPEIPYGIAISAAGLWVIANDILTTPLQ
jgi:prepilin peptidase CpaA